MQTSTQLSILIVAAYFVGAIPFGLLVGKLKGVDIRQHGSRNIGATNAGRVLGRKYFWVVFLLDLLKGALPVAIASGLIAGMTIGERSMATYALWIVVGAAAMLGHVFPVYLGFKGGKGVATGLGIVIGLYPYFTLAGLICAGVFVVAVLLTRYVSVGSILAAGGFPFVYAALGLARGWDVFGDQVPLLAVSSILALMIVLRHRANITRLMNGTELKVGARST